MQRFIFAFPIILLAISCSRHAVNQFSLTGKTDHLPEGTEIFLLDVLTNQRLDSTTVQNGRFHFKGRLPAAPTNMALHTADYSEMKSIWMENARMVFDASGASFEDARMTGSKTQEEAELLYSRLRTTEDYDEQVGIAMEFVSEYPDSRVSAAVLSGYAQNAGKARVAGLYEKLSPENKASVYGKRISDFLRLNKTHEIGGPYSDFAMKNPAGETIRFSDHLGRATLLEFWASWCGPCREENPELVEIYRQYQEKGFQIVSVSLDFSKENWVKAIREDGLPWVHVSDLGGRNSTAGIIYGINSIPDNFLLDEKGNIAGRGLWGAELRSALEQLLPAD